MPGNILSEALVSLLFHDSAMFTQLYRLSARENCSCNVGYSATKIKVFIYILRNQKFITPRKRKLGFVYGEQEIYYNDIFCLGLE
jgi:hypothetical protein